MAGADVAGSATTEKMMAISSGAGDQVSVRTDWLVTCFCTFRNFLTVEMADFQGFRGFSAIPHLRSAPKKGIMESDPRFSWVFCSKQ